MKIILASGSPRRQMYMKNLGFDFEVKVSNADEKLIGKNPVLLAKQLAMLKASTVAKEMTGTALVIGADSIVICKGKLLGKPKNRSDCRNMLRFLSGSSHKVITGVCMIRTDNKKILVKTETTFVRMRNILPSEIERYILTDEPYDKAAGYGIQGTAAMFIESVRGCYTNITGFPVPLVLSMLKTMGIKRD